jgi:probable phosphoglycerate mutase
MTHTIYMIRHGQTDWNAEKRLQGQTEVAMNEVGRGQVQRNAAKLKRLLGDPARWRYLSSPIGRAAETMRIMRRAFGLPEDAFERDSRLCELDFGEFAGHSWSELRRSRPADVEHRFQDSWNYVCPGGESYRQLAARVFACVDAIGEDTVITAHAGVSRTLQSRFIAIEPAQIAFLDAPQDTIMMIRDGKLAWV